MRAIFPIVGGGMFGKMLLYVGEEVYDVEHKALMLQRQSLPGTMCSTAKLS